MYKHVRIMQQHLTASTVATWRMTWFCATFFFSYTNHQNQRKQKKKTQYTTTNTQINLHHKQVDTRGAPHTRITTVPATLCILHKTEAGYHDEGSVRTLTQVSMWKGEPHWRSRRVPCEAVLVITSRKTVGGVVLHCATEMVLSICRAICGCQQSASP